MYYIKIYTPYRDEVLAKVSRYISLNFEDKLNAPSNGKLVVSLSDYEVSTDIFEKYNRVSIFKDAVEKWRGYISDISVNKKSVEISLLSIMSLLKKRLTTKEYKITALDANLVGYWALDEGTGTVAVDQGIVPHNGVITGGTYVEGRAATGLLFSGAGKVAIGDYLDFQRTNACSFSMWIKTTTTAAYSALVSKMGPAATFTGWEVGINSSGAVCFNLVNTWGSNAISLVAGTGLNDGKLHHIAVTYNGSSTAAGVIVYIDGIATTTVVSQNTLSATTLNTSSLTLGQRPSADFPYTGMLDEVRIYNSVLTPANILTLGNFPYSSRNTGIIFEDVIREMNEAYPTEFVYGGTDLYGTVEEFDFTDKTIYDCLQSVAKTQSAEIGIVNKAPEEIDYQNLRYQFNEAGGAIVYDSSGNGYNATLTGVAREEYKYGYEVQYPGNNVGYYVDMDYRAINGLEDFTVFCRVRLETGLSTQPTVFSCATATNTNEMILIYTEASSTWGIYLKGVLVLSVVSTVVNDKLLHTVLVEREGNKLRLFIDNIQVGATTTVVTTALVVDSGGFILGQEQDSVGGGFQAGQSWSGDIGDFRVFKRALTEDERLQVYVGNFDREKTEVRLVSQVGEDKSDPYASNAVAFKYLEDRIFETNIQKPDYTEEGADMANYIIGKNDESPPKYSYQEDVDVGKDRIEKTITFSGITSQNALDEATLDYLNKHKDPKKNPVLIPIVTKLDDSLYNIGDLCIVNLKYSTVNFNANYRIVSKNYEIMNNGEYAGITVETSNNSLSRENFFAKIASMDSRIADLES